MNISQWNRRRYAVMRRIMSKLGDYALVRADEAFSYSTHALALEHLFPGCSAAWDANSVTRAWDFYTLHLHDNHPHKYLGITTPRTRESHHHARLWGHYVLFAIKKKDGLVQHDSFRIEWRESRATFHATRSPDTGQVETLESLTHARGGQWSAYRDRTAWYVPQEERWTVIQ